MCIELPSIICSVDWHAVLAGSAYFTGALLQFLGIVGCVVPILPGPVLAFAGMGLLYCTPTKPSWPIVLLAGIVVVIAFILDYVVPSIGAKAFKCSKLGVTGCFIGSLYGFVVGSIAGMFAGFLLGAFTVLIGIMVFSFVGTFVGEAFSNKEMWPSVRGAFGSFIGFVAGILIKMTLTTFIAALFALTVAWPLVKKACN